MSKVKQCFLIDDDIDDQEIFNLALAQLSYPVDCEVANNAIEALDRFRSDSSFVPDHIFIDVNMPRMNGIECLKEIKKMKHLDGSEIFIYSTTSDHRIITMSHDLGAQFIMKPSSLDTLVDILNESLTSNPNSK
jgi:DNA-binding NtrC family response regulator